MWGGQGRCVCVRGGGGHKLFVTYLGGYLVRLGEGVVKVFKTQMKMYPTPPPHLPQPDNK